jgi:PEGA domain
MITRSWVGPARARRAAGVVLCSLAMMVGGEQAWAEGAPAGAASNAATATQLYGDGVAAAKLNQWEKARASFAGAWALEKHWQIAANLGRAELQLGKFHDAMEHLTFFLREAPASVGADERKQGEEMLAQARARVGAIKVTVAPADAEVLIDGTSVGTAPQGDIFVEPGERVIEARREGYARGKQKVVAPGGTETMVELKLVKVEAAGPIATPERREGGPNPMLVKIGARTAIIGGAIGAGALIGSFIALGARNSAAREASGPCHGSNPTNCPDSVKTPDYLRSGLATGAFWTLIAAGAIGATTLTYALVTAKGNKDDTHASLVIGPQAMGAILVKRW